MSDNIQDKETLSREALEYYCLEKYEEALQNITYFVIQEYGTGKRKFEEELNGKR